MEESLTRLEARIRVHSNSGIPKIYHVVVADSWLATVGPLKPAESFIIYDFGDKKGKIVPARYGGGMGEFTALADPSLASMVDLPDSLISAARTPLFNPNPISGEDMGYIKKNCYRPGPVSE